VKLLQHSNLLLKNDSRDFYHLTHLPTKVHLALSPRIADKVKKPPIQDAVEKATSEMLLQPDWESNIVICDAIQQKPEL